MTRSLMASAQFRMPGSSPERIAEERPKKSIKVLALIEAATVGGPAGNLIDFCRRAREFGDAGVEASIVTFNRGPQFQETPALHHDLDNSRPNEFVAAAIAAGLPVDVIEERFRFDPRVISRLNQIVEERAPDLVQTHNVKSHFLMRASGLCGRFPWVAFHHGYTHTDLKMRAYNKLDRWSLPRANRVVTVSRAFAAQLQRTGVKPERLMVLHNSVRAEEFSDRAIQAGRISPGIAPGERVILAVGRLSREKGHAVLIRAFSGLLRHDPRLRAKLVLVGDGPERQRLQRAAVSFGVEDCVVFAGQVGDVRPYYKAADVMVLPSYTEGSPNVLLEAMAAGLPVVATSVGGVPEIVTDGESALLTPPGDSHRMAAAMSALLNHGYLSRKLAANARAVVCRRHSPEIRVNALIRIYDEVASRVAG